MKSIYILSLILLTNYSAPAALLAWWKLDETTGNIVDSTGQNPDGVPFGTPVYGTQGVPNGLYGSISGGITVANAAGTSISFGPSTVDSQFIAGIDNNNPVMNIDQTGKLTVMGWLKPNTPELTAGHTYRMISTGSSAGADFGWGLGLRLTPNPGTQVLEPFARFTGYSVVDKDVPIPTTSFAFNQWIHLAATYDNGVTTLYYNGEFLGTHADTRLFNNDTVNARLVIGGRLGGSNNEQANGLIDGLRVYDTVLTVEEIRAAAAASVVPEPSAGLLGLVGTSLILRRQRRASAAAAN